VFRSGERFDQHANAAGVDPSNVAQIQYQVSVTCAKRLLQGLPQVINRGTKGERTTQANYLYLSKSPGIDVHLPSSVAGITRITLTLLQLFAKAQLKLKIIHYTRAELVPDVL
jgi:hypothetical protein